MGRGAGFEQILDEKLAAARPSPAALPARSSSPLVLVPDQGLRLLAWGAGVHVSRRAGAYEVSAHGRFVRPGTASEATEVPPPARAERRILSVQTTRAPLPLPSRSERRAMECLCAPAGPRLAAGVTGDELKRAFRVLARLYHPDSHPAASESERAHLGATFARISANYRRLAVSARQRAA